MSAPGSTLKNSTPGGGRVRRAPLGAVDARASDPPQPDRWRAGVLLDLVPGRHADQHARRRRGTALGHRGRVRDCQDGARARPQRDPLLAWVAPACLARDARLRNDGRRVPSRERAGSPKKSEAGSSGRNLIGWSVQEIRRVAMRLAQRRIEPAHVIAWSLWRRAHQAAARGAHTRRRPQLLLLRTTKSFVRVPRSATGRQRRGCSCLPSPYVRLRSPGQLPPKRSTLCGQLGPRPRKDDVLIEIDSTPPESL
jgi:hypothetical protein